MSRTDALYYFDKIPPSVVRALTMLAGDPGSIPGHATNFSNFSEGIGKPL